MPDQLRFLTDGKRHLVCLPYSIENLHRMAKQLGIRRCWYHGGRHPHYDIPQRRYDEITEQCEVMSSKHVLIIIKEGMAKDKNVFPPEKGYAMGPCFRSSCEVKVLSQWYNRSTRKFYCEECAQLINKANYADAIRLYGGPLCIKVKNWKEWIDHFVKNSLQIIQEDLVATPQILHLIWDGGLISHNADYPLAEILVEVLKMGEINPQWFTIALEAEQCFYIATGWFDLGTIVYGTVFRNEQKFHITKEAAMFSETFFKSIGFDVALEKALATNPARI